MNQKPNMSTAKSVQKRNTWIPILFWGFFVLVGSVISLFMFVIPLYRMNLARNWVEVECEVLSSRVEEHTDSEGDSTYSIEITYRYTYEGLQYTSDAYNFTSFSSSGYDGKAAVVDEHPPGLKTKCFVNPQKPSEAVLSRDFSSELWFGLIPLVFVVIGVCGLLATTGLIRFGGTTDDVVYDGGELPTGPLELKSSTTPFGRFIGMLFMTLFWNGIVSIFVAGAVNGHLIGRPDWFLTIFMIPFVLIGLALVGIVFYTFLGLMTPRPILTLGQAVIRLGETTDLKWRFEKSIAAFRSLQIKLVGKEYASYTEGTSTHKDDHEFFSQLLYDEAAGFEQGLVAVHIPPDTMHSFESDNNEIVWQLEVKGDVARWPDVNDSYPLVVLPHAR